VDLTLVATVLLVVMLVCLAAGVWVAISLLGVGLVGMLAFTSAPAGKVMGTTTWGASGSWALTALPLFIWMAEILFRTRLAEDMFRGLAPWLTALPGRLIHVNIVGCGVFAAVSGSTSATCATISKITLPELQRRGYDERMVIGTLTASGTLGILIPPSIMMIVYGFIAEVSIARLFIAGVGPGALMIALFMGYVVVWAWLHPERTPSSDIRMRLGERLAASRRLAPVLSLIAGVVASMYLGIATPTEAATVGVVGALLISLAYGTLTPATFVESLLATTRTSCMIAFILAGAAFMAMAMAYTGIPKAVAAWISGMQLPAYGLLAALTALYVLLGFALDGISMVVLTSAVVQPMVRQAGIDPIWFGVYIVLMAQIAELTPPVGFPMFVMQMFTGRDLLYISRAALPFFFLLLLGTAIITVFPGIATYLPAKMLDR
jgi:tripartite ATP-independent transporter DctM subunit